MHDIGEILTESTKQRFADKESPDGKKWKENSPATIQKKGRDFPLTGETGLLGRTINDNVDGNVLEIGSPIEYATIRW